MTGRPSVYLEIDGKMWTYSEIAKVSGVPPETIRSRHRNGRHLFGPDLGSMRSQKEDRFKTSVVDDELPYQSDANCQAIHDYLQRREPLTSVQEIAEMMECDLEEACLYREELQREIFGDGPTLTLLGDLLGLSRERVWQIEHSASRRLRSCPKSRELVNDMRDDMDELAELRNRTAIAGSRRSAMRG